MKALEVKVDGTTRAVDFDIIAYSEEKNYDFGLDFVWITIAGNTYAIGVSNTGLIDGLPLNHYITNLANEWTQCRFGGLHMLVGDAIIVKDDGSDDFVSLTPEEIVSLESYFKNKVSGRRS